MRKRETEEKGEGRRRGRERRKEEDAQPWPEDVGDELLLPHALTLPELEEKSPKLHLLQAQAMEEPEGRSTPSSHPRPSYYTWSIPTTL